METLTIHSHLYEYSVQFVESFGDQLQGFSTRTAYVIDKNIYRLYQKEFASIPQERIYQMEAVEDAKTMETVMDIISFLQDLHVHKNWQVVCFGGGITQDVTTMASSLFLRNVDWYFFPTTLLSMCDSCIGGKCGINFRHIKNQLGVFYPPKKIFIDVRFLETLTHADYLNGWGELLKFSLTSNPQFYADVRAEEHYIPCDHIASYIHRGLHEKQKIIEQDEFDLGLRRVLNYGHSFGHALEAYTENDIPHGKAVIWGIDVVNDLAVQEGLIPEAYALDIKALIKRAFLPEEIVIDQPERMIELLRTDKKVRDNTMNFAMLDGRSHLTIHPMELDDRLLRLFKDYLRKTHDYYRA